MQESTLELQYASLRSNAGKGVSRKIKLLDDINLFCIIGAKVRRRIRKLKLTDYRKDHRIQGMTMQRAMGTILILYT